MSESSPRIPPVPLESMTDEQKELVGKWRDMNFARVIVNHPELYRAFVPLIAKLIPGSNLPPRERQIVVLRILSLYDEVYEVTHQVLISQHQAGMNDTEIESARAGKSEGLSEFDQTLMRATEEQFRDRRISDETWEALSKRYSTIELMELVALIAGYSMMAMVTTNFEMPLEDPEIFNGFAKMRKYK